VVSDDDDLYAAYDWATYAGQGNLKLNVASYVRPKKYADE